MGQEQGFQPEWNELIRWPDTMWPITPDSLAWLPAPLMPDIDDLNRLVYPWELLTLLQTTMKDRITETRISPTATVEDDARIRGPVWIEDGATVYDRVHIDGPSYIGRGARIGTFNIIRACLIGPNTDTGAKSDITRSVLGPDCSLHNTYIGDSLLGADVMFGGSSGTSNLKLDKTSVPSVIHGKRVDTQLTKLGAIVGNHAAIAGGVNIMPGVKIGEHAQIWANIVLSADVPDHTVVFLRQDQGRLTIKPR